MHVCQGVPLSATRGGEMMHWPGGPRAELHCLGSGTQFKSLGLGFCFDFLGSCAFVEMIIAVEEEIIRQLSIMFQRAPSSFEYCLWCSSFFIFRTNKNLFPGNRKPPEATAKPDGELLQKDE